MRNTNSPTSRQGGQVLVLLVLSLVAVFAMLGLIIDGGNAFANQRQAQNAADSAANAGAVVLAQDVGQGVLPVMTDGQVLAAVTAAGTENSTTVGTAYYTDSYGNLLTPLGAQASDPSVAAKVGGGSIPPCLPIPVSGVYPCPAWQVNGVPISWASGVRAIATKDVKTYLSGVIGLNTIAVATSATAVSGYINNACPAAAGCDIMPVTFPVTVVTCDGSGNAAPLTGSQWPSEPQTVVVPLCGNNPGNVGWIDWTPPSGGTSELIDSIVQPDNPAIPLPSWQYVTETGNVNSQSVQDALNDYAGKIILLPQFDGTCDAEPVGGQLSGCPPGHTGGSGQNQWYHLPQLAAFKLTAAYVNGNNSAVCDTGNGATSCLVGQFVDFITEGTVGPGQANTVTSSVVGVQLIR